jgi:4-hydroxy-tetrahydrodipicolinate reductase
MLLKIKIGMFGFGKTGFSVAQEIIKDDVCQLEWVVRKSSKNEGEYASRICGMDRDEGLIYSISSLDKDQFFHDNLVDVIIDFSVNSAVETYNKTAVLYSPNITLGINFLIEASKVLQRIVPEADIEIVEEHFKEKPDASGTALRIAEDLGLDKKKHVNSVRVGGIVGKHEVIFGLPNQTIRIIHESLNRSAFGQGAIYAAKWLMTKSIGIYTMEEAVHLSFARNFKVFKIDE